MAVREGVDLCAGIRLQVPIMQAALGACDGPALAAAVSRAGGLGTLTVHATEPALLRRQLARIRAHTGRPVLLAFTAPYESEAVLDTALAQGFRHFQMCWWNGPRLSRRVRDAGGVVFWQVSTVEQAEDALRSGADVLVAQGTGAGGQVRGPHPIRELLPVLRAAVSPAQAIVAGGGLADRSDVEEIVALGAQAALLGTRFLLSEEATAPPRKKARLVRACTEDLTLDTRLVGDWPCAPRRRLELPSGEDTSAQFAGCGLSRIDQILPAARIVRHLSPHRRV